MDKVESVVIGAGVIGLAVARQLALAGREVIILEKNAAIGEETSARNSEVIHAGIYYPSGSLKARHCVAGKKALYDFCASRGVPHKRLGKLIVATSDEELPKLQAIKAQAAANGVDDLRFLSQAEVKALEPDLQTVGALLSPSTGIIDSHALMLALLGEAEDKGAVLALQAPVLRGAITDDGFRLEVGGEQPMELACRILINVAGHGAWALARGLKGYPQDRVPPRHLAKGSYFTLLGKTPFQRLVYPVPTVGGLGTHLTLDMNGRARFGPDVEWLDPDAPLDYAVDPARGDNFYAAIRRYWPALPDGALQAGYSGIRPKLSGPKDSAADFLIDGPAAHGIKGLVQLFGIESPGLTACLSIADEVANKAALAKSSNAMTQSC